MATKTPKPTGSASYRDKGYTQISIYLSSEEIEILDQIAKKERRSRTNVVTHMVAMKLAMRGKK